MCFILVTDDCNDKISLTSSPPLVESSFDSEVSLASPARDDALSSSFVPLTMRDITPPSAAARELLTINVRSLRVTKLTARLSHQLPRASPAFRSIYASSISSPVCFSDFKRRVSKSVLNYAHSRSHLDGLTKEEIHKILQPDLSDWRDPFSYTLSYHELVDVPGSPVSYSRSINMANVSKPFPLEKWVTLHLPHCQICRKHHQAHGGMEGFFRHNDTNMCPVADVLSWLSGEWRIPFASIPPAASRKNYESLFFDVKAIKKEIDRMKDWGTIIPGVAHLVHPAMGIIRDSDLREACRILNSIGRPSPSEEKKDVAINKLC